MKKRYIVIISIILLILDTSLCPFISIKGAYPSLLFVFAVSYAVINGSTKGIGIGIFSGVLQDIFFSQSFGINILTNLIICYIVGVIGEGILREKKLIPLISVLVSSIVKVLLVYVIMRSLFDYNNDLGVAIPYAIYNSVITLLIYNKIYQLCNEKEDKYSWKFGKN